MSKRLALAAASLFALLPALPAAADRNDRRPAETRREAALFLFSSEDFRGDIREVFEPVGALPDIDFNDRARSVSVVSGQWEICEHGDFTGRCVFLREDVADLGWFGLSGRVSSARPIYEFTEARHGLLFTRDRNGDIRYAENESHGDDKYRFGYSSRSRLEAYHYGYSPDYRRYGYYNPLLGYDPYGFGWRTSPYDRYGSQSYYNPYYDPWHSDYYRRRETHFGDRNGALTVFQHSNGNGFSLGLNGSVNDLRSYRFNDVASSLSIREGQWEVCDGANFSGNCRIIDASNGIVNLSGFNDRLSSIRRVDSGGGQGSGHGSGHGSGRGRGHGGGIELPIRDAVQAGIGHSGNGSRNIRSAVPVPPVAPVYTPSEIVQPQAPVLDPVQPAYDPPAPPRRRFRDRIRDDSNGDVSFPVMPPQDLGSAPVYEAPRPQPVYDPPPRFDPPPSYVPPPAYDPPPRFDPPPAPQPSYDPPPQADRAERMQERFRGRRQEE